MNDQPTVADLCRQIHDLNLALAESQGALALADAEVKRLNQEVLRLQNAAAVLSQYFYDVRIEP